MLVSNSNIAQFLADNLIYSPESIVFGWWYVNLREREYLESQLDIP